MLNISLVRSSEEERNNEKNKDYLINKWLFPPIPNKNDDYIKSNQDPTDEDSKNNDFQLFVSNTNLNLPKSIYQDSQENDFKRYFIEKENFVIEITKSEKAETKKNKNRNIFKINKTKKNHLKIGRLNKNLKQKYSGKHDKYCEDNIIRKIKTSFIQNSLDYINKQYELYLNNNKLRKTKKLLQRINPKEYLKIKITDNKNWFQSTLKKIFSANLSKKCSKSSLDYNRRQLDILYQQNMATNVINILDRKIIDLYNDYINDTNLEGFKTLKDDLKNLRERMAEENENEEKIEEYLKKYREIAKDLENIFDRKKGRNHYSK